MRKYQPIWELLKEESICTISLDINALDEEVNNVINMVRLEKTKDTEFKSELVELDIKSFLYADVTRSEIAYGSTIIRFRLEFKPANKRL